MLSNEAVKIITGVRRCGKSTLLMQYKDTLISDGIKESNIHFMNFEDLAYLTLREPSELLRYIMAFFEKKAILTREPKYYVVDTGIRTVLTSPDSQNLGSILENLIYLELLRQGHRVFVGRIGETEINFVTEKDGSRMYIQVARSILDEGTAEREFRPFMLVKDNYPKYPDTGHD